jgi:hypothetical protein
MACFAIPTAPVFIEATSAPSGVRVLDLDEKADPEGARAFRTVLPVYSFPEIKSGPKQFRGLHGFGTANMLHTSADTDPDLIYHMVKWWDENFDAIKTLHPSIALSMSTEFNYALFNEMFLPTHEGTIRFFKEKGLWTPANQRRQDYLVKLLDIYTQVYEEALAEAKRKGITVDPGNQDWTSLWEQHKKNRQLPPFRIMSDAEIETALARMQ